MLTEEDRESTKPGVSILAQEVKGKNRRKHSHKREHEENNQNAAELSLRLTSLRTLLVYLFLFAVMAGVFLVLDSAPRLPERIWSWQEIWDKLSGPSAGVPLDFIKYLTCSLGWFMLTYVAFTLVLEGLVDIFYLLSVRLGNGRPNKLAQGLKKVTGLLPVSPARRALDGLLLGAAFFAVVTTVAGGRGATSNSSDVVPGNDLDRQINPPEAAGLVLEASNNYQADYSEDNLNSFEPAFYKTTFQPQNNNDNSDSDYSQASLLQTDVVSPINKTVPLTINLYSQEMTEVKHKVEAGDSLWSLAERYYGNGQRYTEIYQANLGQPVGGGHHFEASGVIQPGWVLTIPNVSKVQADNTWDMTTSVPKQTQEQSQEVYVVQRGDTMRAIAQKFLGDEMRWPEIWKLNVNHTMKDGRVPTNPDLIFPGWELKLPTTTIGQPQPQPTNNGKQQGQEQPTKNVSPTPTPTQPPGNSTTTNPVQTPTVTTPTPNTTPSVTPAPATTPSPQITAQQPVTQPGVPQPGQQPAQSQKEDWLWPVLQGLGSLLALGGLGLGLRRVGGVLRKRWKNGELGSARRSRWQAYREANEWESENAPQTHAVPSVQTNEWGDETGFASTDRPLELLNLLANGFDADRPKLVLQTLQILFANEGLPPLQPVSCIEFGRRLTYQFTGSPQTLALYLEAASETEIDGDLSYSTLSKTITEEDEEWEVSDEEQEEISSDKGKVIPFLSGLGRRKGESETEALSEEETTQGELVEAIISKFGGMAWIEKQREGIVVSLEGVEQRFCYSPIASIQSAVTVAEAKVALGEIEPVPFADFSVASDYDSDRDDSDVYQAYGGDDENELISQVPIQVPTRARTIDDLQSRSYGQVRQEFAQISRENGVSETASQYDEELEPVADELPPGYVFFGLGAVSVASENYYFASSASSQSEDSEVLDQTYGHFHFCLDISGNLLLVSSKGDEAAKTALYNSVFQIAAATDPNDVALYLVDRPVALADEEIQNIGQEFGLSAEVQAAFTEELEYNREFFTVLAELPQTVALIEGDIRGNLDEEETSWTRNTAGLIDMLLEELIRRRAEAAGNEKALNEQEQQLENKLPRLVLVISDLRAVAATDQSNALTQLLSDGPQWGIYVLAAVSYEAVVLQNAPSSQSVTPLINQFGSIGLFVAPDERSSEQLLGGSSAAFELSGDGDLLFRSVNKQLTRMRGFRAEFDQIKEGAKLLHALYTVETSELEVEKSVKADEPYKAYTNDEVEQIDVVTPVEEPEVKDEVEGAEYRPVEIPATVEKFDETETDEIVELSILMQAWRWRMLQNGLLQPAITIHVLHGLTVHFGLLPTPKKNRIGRGHYFPFSPEPLAAYEQLKEVGLSFSALAKLDAENDSVGKIDRDGGIKPERVDQLLGETLELWGTSEKREVPDSQLMGQLIEQGFDLQEIEEAFLVLQKILHNFSWLESDNLMPRIQNGDLALMSYLALHGGGQSSYTVGQAILKPTETDKQLLRNLEVRLTRTHKSLRNWVISCLQEIFGDQPDAKEQLAQLVKVQNLNFIEADTKRETLKLNDQLVWVDVGELDRLLTEYKRTATTEKTAERIKWLEEAYWLVQSTADIHNDAVEESRLKLLGVWGDHHAADWEDLAIMRQHVVQRWFDLNMTLGDYYTRVPHRSEQPQQEDEDKYIALATEHYSQATLVQPTYPEPVKALIQLYHSKNDLSGLRTVFNDYCANCKQDEQEPEEDVIELYDKAVGSRRRKKSETIQQRKVI